MENLLLSIGSKLHESVEESYVLPPELRPHNLNLKSASACKTSIPVIDLGGADDDANEEITMNKILQVGKEFGCFQVLNHGILLDDIRDAAEEFFELPNEDKEAYYSDDPNKLPLLSTGAIAYRSSGKSYWRDFFRLNSYPVNEFIHLFPAKPPKFRDAIARYTVETRGLAMKILRLIGKGLIGLDDEDYFDKIIKGAPIKMLINHYPPCPDPSLTMGLPKHVDTTLLTLLLQRDVSGLRVLLHDGEWIEVDPLPNAIIVLFGLPMEFFTNGLLRGVEHQAVTNATAPRTTIGMFVVPTKDCLVAPPPTLITDQMPCLYSTFNYAEFTEAYAAAENDREKTLETFAIKH